MAKKPKTGGTVLHDSDVFMQWQGVQLTADGADSSVIVETEIPTGMSARGSWAWAIHTVEVIYQGMYVGDAADNRFEWALSTRQGLAAFPELDEVGCICAFHEHFMFATAVGEAIVHHPLVWKSLPPTLIATSKLSVYYRTAVDDAAHQDKDSELRIGYTTVPLASPNMWLEIAETWGAGL